MNFIINFYLLGQSSDHADGDAAGAGLISLYTLFQKASSLIKVFKMRILSLSVNFFKFIFLRAGYLA